MDVSEIPRTDAAVTQIEEKKEFTSEYKAACVDRVAIQFGLNPGFVDCLLSSMNRWQRTKFLKSLAKST